ncbi:MAG TPA: hypothetical protein VMN39_07510, partial [Longimicrobiaceae bacterium]|nr:hypothetical protein [Longimicrobiaceae bacterium]
MKTREKASSYRERMALAVVALLFSSMLALYMIFADTARVRLLGDPFRGSPALTVRPEAERLAHRVENVVRSARPDAAVQSTSAGGPADPALPSEEPGEAAPPPPSRAVSPLELARKLAGERAWPQAIAIYDRLHAAQPEAQPLAIERARVLAWSGDPRAAAAALGRALGNDATDPELRLEQANFLWWAADFARADSVVGLVAGMPAVAAAADSLRTRIRQGAEPDVPLAEEWLRSRPTALEHLLLARALARGGRGAEAVPHYRAAQRMGSASDEITLEVAAVAAGADSLAAASEALARYLNSHPGDAPNRLQLARYFAWSGRTDEARREYAVLLMGPA